MVRIVAVALIVVGVIALAYGGISWTHSKTVVDIGPVELQTKERETIPLPPIVGGLCVAAGVGLLLLRR